MSSMPSANEDQSASLVGSLQRFSLPTVLGLLATTDQSGRLQVVGGGLDGRLWVDGDKLIGSSLEHVDGAAQAVFDLALITDGWFYFTSDDKPATQSDPVSIKDVLSTLGPKVTEWHALLEDVPLSAKVGLSPEPPGDDVQIRGQQWQVLTTVSNEGMVVNDVILALKADKVDSLRLLHEMVKAGLLVVKENDEPAVAEAGPVWEPVEDSSEFDITWDLADEPPVGGLPTAPENSSEASHKWVPPAPGVPPRDPDADLGATPPDPPPGWQSHSEAIPADAVEVSRMPPPISSDPLGDRHSTLTIDGKPI